MIEEQIDIGIRARFAARGGAEQEQMLDAKPGQFRPVPLQQVDRLIGLHVHHARLRRPDMRRSKVVGPDDNMGRRMRHVALCYPAAMTHRPAAHIGIVACSAEGAALCYRTICAEGAAVLGPHAHPEVSMHTPPLAEYLDRIDAADWPGVAGLMLESADKLARIGAEFLICPDNTIHQAMAWVAPRSPLPWLHIAEVVAAEAQARGFRRLGLTGTKWLVASEVYPRALAAHGLDYVRPSPEECAALHDIINDELVYGVFRPEGIAYFQQVIARLKDAGCDAVILGCTEIPLIMHDGNSPLPTLDSTRLLARAALRRAVGD